MPDTNLAIRAQIIKTCKYGAVTDCIRMVAMLRTTIRKPGTICSNR